MNAKGGRLTCSNGEYSSPRVVHADETDVFAAQANGVSVESEIEDGRWVKTKDRYILSERCWCLPLKDVIPPGFNTLTVNFVP